MNQPYNDLIGEILKNAGEKDNYQGKGRGKPLPKDYLDRDILQNFQDKAKQAGYLPEWLKLQKEISALIQTAKSEKEIDFINKKIRKYNSICPNPMQKGLISLEKIETAKTIW